MAVNSEWQEVPEMDSPFEGDPFEEMEEADAPEAKPEPMQTPAPRLRQPESVPPIEAGDAQIAEARKRAEFEAAEAKRKAEWEEQQRKKQAARQTELDRIRVMNDQALVEAATQKAGADTEKLTRRNMRECVCEHIQTLCCEDPAFARLTLTPPKSMIRCFAYISRKAWDYVQDELKANGQQPGRGAQGYGCDVPDDLCYTWAEEYFRDPHAKEDAEEEEKFVSKTYPGAASARAKSKTPAKKKAMENTAAAPEEKKPETPSMAQLSLGDFAA